MNGRLRLVLVLAVAALATLALSTPALAGGNPPPVATPDGRYLVVALLNPERIVTVDLATGLAAERRLAGGTLCRSALHVVGDRIVFLSPGAPYGHVMSVDLALRERPREIARADVMAPSTVPGRAWLGVRTDRGRLRVRQLWVASRFSFRARHTAPAAPLLGAVPEGLVLGGRRSVYVFDPQHGRRLRGTPGALLIATHGSQIVSCGDRCATLLVADGSGGRLIHAPDGAQFLGGRGSFSADGGLVAVPLGPWPSPRVALVDVAAGASSVVPELRLGTYLATAWSQSRRLLYAVEHGGRVVTYAPGDVRPQPTELHFDDTVMQLLLAG
jgi:hypothetical protein